MEPCDWSKRGHMIKIELSHWSRRLLVFFPIHLGVEGFVINGWDLSNLGYSPYMTNFGDKSHIKIIRDIFYHNTVVYRGPYSTKPSDKLRPIWSVTSGWDLSYVGGFVIFGWGLSYLGGICHMWGGLSYMGIKSYSRRISSQYLSK